MNAVLTPDQTDRLARIKTASARLRSASGDEKSRTLAALAKLLESRKDSVIQANARDLAALPNDAAPAFRDRLTLNAARIGAMAESLRQVATLEDPVGELVDERKLANGLHLKRVRAPIGVVFMIFESRPNVATEAFSIAFKSGNAIILRGGKESKETCGVLYALIQEALVASGLPSDGVWGITNPDRVLVNALLARHRDIDLVVPRGGESLIEFVVSNTRIPIIKNDRGLCHAFIDDSANFDMAESIVINAKTQRPGVCNALETVLVHADVAEKFIPRLYKATHARGVKWWACPRTMKILGEQPDVQAALNWDTEHLDLVLSVRVVLNLNEALAHITRHGSKHSEVIVTESEPNARRFQNEVDAAAVYWNASTRFTDGFEFGLGGELGISTQKLHVRGPVGPRELTTPRWIGDGNGQVRI